jgi:putative ABC transport system ATP-binding protein
MGTLVEARGLAREYRMGEVTVHALRGVDLEIGEGEVIVLLGPSGSGKTTLLNLLGGLDSPTGGTVSVSGEEIAGYDARRLADYRARSVGFVFQFFNLLPSLTAAENIEFARVLVDGNRGRAHDDAVALLGQVGLAERADHFPGQLSGGEQQRVAIARSLANQPRLLLCDEPTGSLDVETGRQVLEVLDRAGRETGAAIVLVTHNSAIAPMADRVLHLRDGRIEKQTRNEQPKAPAELSW